VLEENMNPIDMRHFSREVYGDLLDRLDAAFEAHVARFPDLDRNVLRGGFVSAMAVRAGQILLGQYDQRPRRAVAVMEQCRLLANAAEIQVAEGPPAEVRRDPPGVN
jgi:hypothetical protein